MSATSEIMVLGTGCRSCAALYQNAKTAARMVGRDESSVEKVTDFDRIAAFKPWALPALVIRGDVVLAGTIAPPHEVARLLSHADERASPSRSEANPSADMRLTETLPHQQE